MANDERIEIEVSYARPDTQLIIPVTINADMTVQEAIEHSGILEKFPEINLEKNKVGVFGKLTKLTSTLRSGERIEIYRQLIADPKAVRKQRAAEGKAMKKGGGAVEENQGDSNKPAASDSD